jgi:hypothetical protein
MRLSTLSCALVFVVLGAAGCGHAKSLSLATRSTRSTAARSGGLSDGSVIGTLGIFGGVQESGRKNKNGLPEAGTVRFEGARAKPVDVPVGKSGKFSLDLPAGRYTVVAGLKRPMDWPMGSCSTLFHSGHYDRTNHSFYIVLGQGERLHVHVACVAG